MTSGNRGIAEFFKFLASSRKTKLVARKHRLCADYAQRHEKA